MQKIEHLLVNITKVMIVTFINTVDEPIHHESLRKIQTQGTRWI